MINLEEVFEKLLKGDKEKGIILNDGWVYSGTFRHLQKVNDKVYVYISPIYGGIKIQMYLRAETMMCNLEAQSHSKSASLFSQILLMKNDEGIRGKEDYFVEAIMKNIKEEDVHLLFNVAEDWLESYGGNPEGHVENIFYPFSGNWNYRILEENKHKFL